MIRSWRRSTEQPAEPAQGAGADDVAQAHLVGGLRDDRQIIRKVISHGAISLRECYRLRSFS